MSLICPVLRRSLSPLQKASRGIGLWLVAAIGSLTICAADAQSTNPFPLGGLYPLIVPQQSPPLEFSGISDTVTLTWPAAASNFVVESSSDLAAGNWTRETNAVIDMVGDQTIATVPLKSEQQFYRLHGPTVYVVPIYEFAIFYNGLLEFTWSATLTLNGRVHANGDIYVGSGAASPLTFNSLVTTAGGIYKLDWDGHTTNQMTGPINYNGNPGWTTNVAPVYPPVGSNNMPAAMREIINMPPPGEDPSSLMGRGRYYNLASVVLLVSNTTVTVYLKNSPADSPISLTVTNWGTNSSSLLTTFPFLSVTNSFIDQRELSKMVRPTQIDVGMYSQWLATNIAVMAKFPPGSSLPPNILYVADNRSSATNTDLFAVRLVNGAIIPTNQFLGQPSGWTVATPNPLYVWGHYNIGPGGSTAGGNTGTSKTYPASLVSDALTILSGNWSDANSANVLFSRAAVDTTVNAAILTGIVYSSDSSSNHFSGGVQNVPRLLEDWSTGAKTLTLNTSIVNLFDSARATNWFRNPGLYYNAPTRKFSFDQNFTNPTKLPPATPGLRIVVLPQ
jgi:hypothetical protein